MRVARPRQLRHHATDHRAIVAKIWVRGGRKRMETYRRKARRNPLLRGLRKPLRQSEMLFEELRSTIARREQRSHPRNSWISERTWALVDTRARLRRNGGLTGRACRQSSRRINASLTFRWIGRREHVEPGRRSRRPWTTQIPSSLGIGRRDGTGLLGARLHSPVSSQWQLRLRRG